MTRICSRKYLYPRWIEVAPLFGGGRQTPVGNSVPTYGPDTDKLPRGCYLMHCATQRKPVGETGCRAGRFAHGLRLLDCFYSSENKFTCWETSGDQ